MLRVGLAVVPYYAGSIQRTIFYPLVNRLLKELGKGPDMELGRPSDQGIQRPGDPVDPVTLFYNELQMSTYVADKRLQWARVCQFLSLFGVCTLLESNILKIIY